MKRFVEGDDRKQAALLPECVDDYIGPDNPVRIIDVFVDELNLAELGFNGATPALTGRPSYHPGLMLKVYIYGYLNRVPSSRRLERECQRNVELMWLTGRLAPDFRTIADFRRDNGAAIRNVCRRFVEQCRCLKLLSADTVAIDGSKFKAVNSRDKNYTAGKIDKRQQQIEESVQRYLDAIETADRTSPTGFDVKTVRLYEKIAILRQRMRELEQIKQQLKDEPDGQLSLTDPDSRCMTSGGKRTGTVGYNVQAVVDTKHHLIVEHDVTNVGTHHGHLCRMAVSHLLMRAYCTDLVSRHDWTVTLDFGRPTDIRCAAARVPISLGATRQHVGTRAGACVTTHAGCHSLRGMEALRL